MNRTEHQINTAIIGCGWVANEYIKAFGMHPQTKLTALCSRTKDKAKDTARAHHVAVDVYDDYAEMLSRDDIQLVVVATPPHLHKEQTIAVAQSGKHVIIEKPMATTLEDCRAVRDAIAEAKVKSMCGFILRWNPLVNMIKTMLAEHTIGEVFMGEVDYFNGIDPRYPQFGWTIKKDIGVSSLLAAGSHAVDTLRWLMDKDVAEVTQYSAHGTGAEFARYEYDPTSYTLFKFTDGRIGKVASSIECVQPYEFNIRLAGSLGTIRNNKVYSKRKFPGQTDWAEIPTILPDKGDISYHPFTHAVAHFVESIQHDKESHCNAASAYKTHEICIAADRSAERGEAVKLPLA